MIGRPTGIQDGRRPEGRRSGGKEKFHFCWLRPLRACDVCLDAQLPGRMCGPLPPMEKAVVNKTQPVVHSLKCLSVEAADDPSRSANCSAVPLFGPWVLCTLWPFGWPPTPSKWGSSVGGSSSSLQNQQDRSHTETAYRFLRLATPQPTPSGNNTNDPFAPKNLCWQHTK
jgi:hypothetical protein